jgi:hypothetical protein
LWHRARRRSSASHQSCATSRRPSRCSRRCVGRGVCRRARGTLVSECVCRSGCVCLCRCVLSVRVFVSLCAKCACVCVVVC